MQRMTWILGIVTVLAMAFGVEPTPATGQPSTTAPTTATAPAALPDPSGTTLDDLFAPPGVICPILPPECCVVKFVNGCRICASPIC